MTTLKIESLNCRGIRDSVKRADILDRARLSNANIICLEETHIIGRDLNFLRKEWNVKYFISGSQRNAREVMVILDNNFEYNIHNVQLDREGRYILLEIEIPQVVTFLLVNVYFPNDEKVKFSEKLFNIIDQYEDNNIIIVGDWNSVFYIKPSYRSDHSPIGVEIYIQKTPKGPGFWKINNSLLLDPELNNAIKNEMLLIIQTYACTPYHPDFVKNFRINDIDKMIDIKSFWETLHVQIWGLIVSYSGKKKRKQNVEENQLNRKIEILEEEFNLDPSNQDNK